MKAETTKQPVGAQQQNSIESESAMPGKMPPNFALTAGSGDDWSKDGKSKTGSKSNPKLKFEGPLASQGPGDASSMAQDDIFQGRVGDCWVLATIAAFAKANPGYLEKIVQEVAPGKYEVTLYLRDSQDPQAMPKPKVVKVNSTFPVDPSTHYPAYAGFGGEDREIWVMVLEAAFVKALGDGVYQNLNGGDPSLVFEALTGKASTTSYIDKKKSGNQKNLRLDELAIKNSTLSTSEEEIAPLIQAQLEANNPVVLVSNDWENKKRVGNFTIIGHHAYSVLSVDVAGNTISLSDPYGVDHLYDLPVDIVRKYFHSIDFQSIPK